MEHSTLWEGEELALRFLLEDGKLNLCLRLLDDFTKCMLLTSNSAFFAAACVETTLTDGSKAAPIQATSSSHLSSLESFEFGVCTTLHNVWQHSEAMQTTDLPLLLTVIKRMLLAHEYTSTLNLRNSSGLSAFRSAGASTFSGDAAASASEGKSSDGPSAPVEGAPPGSPLAQHKVDLDVCDSSSAFAHLFLEDLGQHITSLGLQLDGIWANLQRGNIVGAWVKACLKNPMELPDHILLAGARGIAGLLHCEEFQMRKGDVLGGQLPALAVLQTDQGQTNASEGKEASSETESSVLQGFADLTETVLPRLSTSAAVKKSIRPLLDLAAYCKRQAKKAKK